MRKGMAGQERAGKMKTGRRMLAGILAVILAFSSPQLPMHIVRANELPAIQENVAEEDASKQEPGQMQENSGSKQEPGEETPAEEQPETGAPEDVSDENKNTETEDPPQTENPAEEEQPSDQETEEPEEKLPADEDTSEETDAELSGDDETISENNVQVSGNSLMSVNEAEVWADAEIEGAYQFGGAPFADEGIAPHAASAYSDEQIMEYLYQQMKARVTPIDVSKYAIPYEKTKPTKIQRLVSGTLNEHPELYYVNGGFSYGYNPTAETITKLNITYETTLNDSEWQRGVNTALASVNQSMSDLQKAIALHDYLTVNCEYDYENLQANKLPGEVYTTYGVFVNRSAVCQGYALAYKYLLQQVGIDCYMVASDEMNHAWNLIELDGQYYQVDVTWDDPVWDMVGRSGHSYMFRSDDAFRDVPNGHHDWQVTYGSQTVDYQAADTRYDNAFWGSCTSPLVMNGSDCYYISPNGGTGGKPALMKADLNTVTAAGTPLQDIDRWTGWLGAFSGLFRIEDRLYFNDMTSIYSVAMDGTDKKTAFTADTTSGYIYGSAYYEGAAHYSLHDSPDLKEKETVLTAELNVLQTYRITYILRGGTNNSANPSTYTEEDAVITLQDPIREGYLFEGWYSDIAYTEKVTQISGEDRSDIVLYAKWKPLAEAEAPVIDLSPAAGNVTMGFSGAYYTETAEKILNRLNAIRLEACKESVRNPDTGRPLTEADYVPLQWSSDLEAIARLRAAEATVSQAHDRPNGQDCFSVVTQNGEQSWAENLAWNNDGLMKGIEQWYGEKNDWVNQTAGKVTGHYTSIISPRHLSVGVGAFRLSSGGWYAVAQEFGRKDGMDAQKDESAGNCVQYMEVHRDHVTKLAFSATPPAFLQEGDSYRLSIHVTVQYNDFYNKPKNFTGPYQAGGNWSSSNEAAAVADSAGEVIAIKKGTTQIGMSVGTQAVVTEITVYGNGESPMTVKAPSITTYKVGQEINLRGGTVTYPSGSGTKTAALAAGMISGFDSSKPGVCTVRVTTGGYTSSFDTLIVEEPKLTAAAGQRLSEIALPKPADGTYTWQDETQAVEKAGVYTFAAEFTPMNETKFQKLSDIKVQVTAQETIGNDTDVAFKTNRFVYNAAEQEPRLMVRSSGVVLKEGQDYELSYENNRNAGEATVTIDGIGCYLGSISKTFRILPAPIRIRAKDKTILTDAAIPADSEYEYEISGLLGMDQLLTPPTIFCAVTDTKTAGQYEIIPSGADAGANYTITYESGSLTVADEYVSCKVTFDVQGHGTAPEARIGVKVGDTVAKPKNPTADGYRFDGWYRDAACTKAWEFDVDIVLADMTLYAKWLEESKNDGGFAFQEVGDMYYTGKACKPAVSVYDKDVLLKSGRDYQIKYYNNTNANKDGALKQGNGEGANFNPALPYVEIIGKGNYTDRIKEGNTDTVKVNFNILRASIGDGKETPASGVTLKVSEQLVTAKKVQKPFSSVKYVKGMKRDTDFALRLTVENARDQEGKSLPMNAELDRAEIPAGYEGTFLLTVEGIGNYTGSVCRTIYVTDKAHLMKNATITLGKNLKNITFAGEAVKLTAAEENSPDTFTVKYGKTFLKPVRDYTVSYRNNDKVGKAELVITGNGEYAGTKAVTFNIKGMAFSARTVQVSGIENKVYTGRALTQNQAALSYVVKDEEPKTLQYGTDYTITYAKNINKGTATMTFRGVEQAGYSGSFKKTFKITAADIADPNLVSRGETMDNMVFPYCKAGAKPVKEIVLTNRDGFILQNGKDYTLAYKNNKAVAEASAEKPPTVTVKGKGNYAGKFDVTFRITQSALKQAVDEGSIQVKTTAVIYSPNKAEDYAYKPAVKLMDGKSALRVNTDYEIQYLNNTQADYEKYLESFRKAAEGGMENAGGDGTGNPDETPSLQELMPKAVITAKAESSYAADGEIIVPLPICETKLVKKALLIDVAEEAVYTGNQVMPAVTVCDAAGGRALTEGKDYEVSYGANNKAGKNRGSVTVTGIAPEYGGSVTVKFDVVRKPIAY